MEPQEPGIPDFRPDGYLPDGVHVASEAEVTFRLGRASRRRRRLILRVRQWIELARQIGARRLQIMIVNATEYVKAQEEIRSLEERLSRLQRSYPLGSKGFTKAGIRKLIARLQEELAVYEGSIEARQPDSN